MIRRLDALEEADRERGYELAENIKAGQDMIWKIRYNDPEYRLAVMREYTEVARQADPRHERKRLMKDAIRSLGPIEALSNSIGGAQKIRNRLLKTLNIESIDGEYPSDATIRAAIGEILLEQRG